MKALTEIFGFQSIFQSMWRHIVLLIQFDSPWLAALWTPIYCQVPAVVFATIVTSAKVPAFKRSGRATKILKRSGLLAGLALVPLPFGETDELGLVYVAVAVLTQTISSSFALVELWSAWKNRRATFEV